MNSRSMAAFMILQVLLAGGSASVPAAHSVHSQSDGSTPSRSPASDDTLEAVVSGRNAVIEVNGDHLEIDDGRLTLNGVSYGRVDERSTVIYRVAGGEKTLRVDGRVRRPAKER